jgi:hypothetical protein
LCQTAFQTGYYGIGITAQYCQLQLSALTAAQMQQQQLQQIQMQQMQQQHAAQAIQQPPASQARERALFACMYCGNQAAISMAYVPGL